MILRSVVKLGCFLCSVFISLVEYVLYSINYRIDCRYSPGNEIFPCKLSGNNGEYGGFCSFSHFLI